MSKASQARHAAFRKEVSDILVSHGATLIRDGEADIKFSLDTKRIGPLEFTMFKHDYDHRPKDELYSIYARLPFLCSKQQVTEAASKVSEAFMDKMNPFSGKWNIHWHSTEDALNTLSDRLKWLMT